MNNKIVVRSLLPRVNSDKHPDHNNSPVCSITLHQSGAVLVISLIMLLLLTLIGVPAIQTTTLEEKMAGNLRNQNLAFQSAETALRVGEAYLLNTTLLTGCVYLDNPPIPFESNTLSVKQILTPPGVEDKEACSSSGSVSSINYRYIIQEISKGSSKCPGGSIEIGISSSSDVNLYRITARGTDASNNAVILLQSIYEKC